MLELLATNTGGFGKLKFVPAFALPLQGMI